MCRDILDLLAVNIDLAPIAQGFQELSAGEGALLAFKNCLGVLRHRVLRDSSRRRGSAQFLSGGKPIVNG
jgi:hypothetical protein